MAKIFKTASIRIPSPGGVPDTFTEDEMELMVTNYWGNIDNERTFPIAIWKLERLLDASTTDEVALRITDIENPNKVDGRWLVFDGNFEDALADPNQPNIYYFVLHENYYNGAIALNMNSSQIRQGMKSTVISPNNTILVGRIGKETRMITDSGGSPIPRDFYYSFFNIATFTLTGDSSGTGGATSGAKVPSGQ